MDEKQKNDAEMLPGVTFTLEDFLSADDFLGFVSGDIGIDVDGVAKGLLENEAVESLLREGWHKSAISAVQAMARHWLDTRRESLQATTEGKDGELSKKV